MRAFYLTMIRLMVIGIIFILILTHFTTYTTTLKHMEPSLFVFGGKEEVFIKEEGEKHDEQQKE
ncbi:hypothetical protein ACFOU2_17820 [Bacillus songklensis]|uniref:Uncharacterized protein n=1 Tax=Bacillus songklensis TaxID=1069116 RepID=A0ABV8B780_9BACI